LPFGRSFTENGDLFVFSNIGDMVRAGDEKSPALGVFFACCGVVFVVFCVTHPIALQGAVSSMNCRPPTPGFQTFTLRRAENMRSGLDGIVLVQIDFIILNPWGGGGGGGGGGGLPFFCRDFPNRSLEELLWIHFTESFEAGWMGGLSCRKKQKKNFFCFFVFFFLWSRTSKHIGES